MLVLLELARNAIITPSDLAFFDTMFRGQPALT